MFNIYYNRIINNISKIFRIYMMHYYLNKYRLNEWSFCINETRNVAGETDYDNNKISISKYFLDKLSLFEYRNLILHEIAHALVSDHKPHSKKWRDKFISIGGNGIICTPCIFSNDDYIYSSFCKECDEKYFCFRRTKIYCDLCGKYLEWKNNN